MALLVILFIVWTGKDIAERWSSSPKADIHWGLVAASVLPIVAVSALQALGWLVLIRGMASTPVRAASGAGLFLASMLGRYLPAKVGMPTILAAGASGLGLTARIMATSMLLVVLIYTVIGLAMGIPLVALTNVELVSADSSLAQLSGPLAISAMASMLLVLVLLAVVDRSRWPKKLLQLLGVEGRGPLVPLGAMLYYAGVWGAWFAHGYLLALAAGGDHSAAFATGGFFILAPVAGFLALITPGGLGVREAVITAGASPWVGPAAAITIAVLSRGISLGIDVLAYVVMRRFVPKTEPAPEERATQRATSS